jgi:hypothetical protein
MYLEIFSLLPSPRMIIDQQPLWTLEQNIADPEIQRAESVRRAAMEVLSNYLPQKDHMRKYLIFMVEHNKARFPLGMVASASRTVLLDMCRTITS